MLGQPLFRWPASIAVIGIALALASCVPVFPSVQLSEELHVRNTDEGVEVLFCSAGEFSASVIGRSLVGSNDGELLPVSPQRFTVESGQVFALGALTTLATTSPLLVPLKEGERLGLTMPFWEPDGEGPVNVKGEFHVTANTIVGFERGEWLSSSSSMSVDPCAS